MTVSAPGLALGFPPSGVPTLRLHAPPCSAGLQFPPLRVEPRPPKSPHPVSRGRGAWKAERSRGILSRFATGQQSLLAVQGPQLWGWRNLDEPSLKRPPRTVSRCRPNTLSEIRLGLPGPAVPSPDGRLRAMQPPPAPRA